MVLALMRLSLPVPMAAPSLSCLVNERHRVHVQARIIQDRQTMSVEPLLKSISSKLKLSLMKVMDKSPNRSKSPRMTIFINTTMLQEGRISNMTRALPVPTRISEAHTNKPCRV